MILGSIARQSFGGIVAMALTTGVYAFGQTSAPVDPGAGVRRHDQDIVADVYADIGDAHKQSRGCGERSRARPKRALLPPSRLRPSVVLPLWTKLLQLWL